MKKRPKRIPRRARLLAPIGRFVANERKKFGIHRPPEMVPIRRLLEPAPMRRKEQYGTKNKLLAHVRRILQDKYHRRKNVNLSFYNIKQLHDLNKLSIERALVQPAPLGLAATVYRLLKRRKK